MTAARTTAIELNASTDNPLVFDNGDVLSGGNFHGQPVAQALDFLAVAPAIKDQQQHGFGSGHGQVRVGGIAVESLRARKWYRKQARQVAMKPIRVITEAEVRGWI